MLDRRFNELKKIFLKIQDIITTIMEAIYLLAFDIKM